MTSFYNNVLELKFNVTVFAQLKQKSSIDVKSIELLFFKFKLL